MNASFLLGFCAGLLPAFLLTHWVAGMQRRTFFGVTVAEGFAQSATGRAILRDFRWRLWGLAVALFGALAVCSRTHYPVAFVLTASALLSFGLMLTTAQGWKETRPYAVAPPRVRSVMLDAAKPEQGRQLFYWSMVALPVAVTVALAAYLALHWKQVPAAYAINWNNDASILWEHRSLWNALRRCLPPLLVQVAVLIFSYGMAYRTRFADWGGDQAGAQRYRALVTWWPVTLSWYVATFYGIRILLPLLGTPALPFARRAFMHAWLGVVFAVLAVMIGLMVLMVRYRSRSAISDSMPDECWKLGQFYWNRNDPAFLVPRRFGCGHTFNFAHAGTWVFLGLIALSIAPMLWK